MGAEEVQERLEQTLMLLEESVGTANPRSGAKAVMTRGKIGLPGRFITEDVEDARACWDAGTPRTESIQRRSSS